MEAKASRPPPELGTVWLDKDIHARRLRVTEVDQTHVTAQVSYSSRPDAFDHPDRTTRVQRKHWYRRFTPERAADKEVTTGG